MAQGGYQKWDVKTRHPDLVGGMVQHHAAVSPAVAQLPELVQNGQKQFLDARALHACELASAISSHSSTSHLLDLPGR